MAPTWIETDTNTNKDISSAASVGVYTSTGDKFVMPQLLADQVAGSGDYVYYVTLQVNGAGSAYVIGPKTTHTAAAGETAIGAQGGFIALRAGDVVTVYIDGLAGDTATPDVTVRWFELDATANVTYWAGVAAGAAPATVADLPAAAPSAAAVADAVWDEALVGHAGAGSAGAALSAAGSAGDPWSTPLPGTYGAGTAGKLLADLPTAAETAAALNGVISVASVSGDVGGSVFGDVKGNVAGSVASVAGNVDGNVLGSVASVAPVGIAATSFDSTALQAIRDTAKLAPTAGAPAAGSIDAHLDDILEDTGTTLPGLLAATVADSQDVTTAGTISRRRGNSWSISLTLGAITGYTSLWFTIKSNTEDADTAAILQIKKNASGSGDGLLYVNGAAASDATKASIAIVDASTGSVLVTVDETITDDLTPGEYVYDAQTLISSATATPETGTFTVTADVTRSVA